MIQQECPCCRDHLHHCKKCWDRFHNGKRHNDYIPPEYFGQSMMSKEVQDKLEKLLGEKMKPTIKADKNQKYREGEYH